MYSVFYYDLCNYITGQTRESESNNWYGWKESEKHHRGDRSGRYRYPRWWHSKDKVKTCIYFFFFFLLSNHSSIWLHLAGQNYCKGLVKLGKVKSYNSQSNDGPYSWWYLQVTFLFCFNVLDILWSCESKLRYTQIFGPGTTINILLGKCHGVLMLDLLVRVELPDFAMVPGSTLQYS